MKYENVGLNIAHSNLLNWSATRNIAALANPFCPEECFTSATKNLTKGQDLDKHRLCK